MESEEFETLELSDEERANWINMLVNENLREKVLVYDPEALERIKKFKQCLKTVLEQDGCDHTISFERCPIFQRSLYLHLEVADFGTSPKNFWLFHEALRYVNSFEALWLPTGKVRLSFYFNFVFKEIT